MDMKAKVPDQMVDEDDLIRQALAQPTVQIELVTSVDLAKKYVL
jgi:hypothetical protein